MDREILRAFGIPGISFPDLGREFGLSGFEQWQNQGEQEQNEAKGPPPTSKRLLGSLKEAAVTAYDMEEESNRECMICLDEMHIGKVALKLPCGHIFDKDCVMEWLEKHCTCPTCRFEMETDDATYEVDRRKRMKTRMPRIRRIDLDTSPLTGLRKMAREQQISLAGCLEKADVIRRIVDSGKVSIVKSTIPEYKRSVLQNLSVKELRMLLQSLEMDSEGCLTKQDLVARLDQSKRITVVEDMENLGDQARQQPQAAPTPVPPATSVAANTEAAAAAAAATSSGPSSNSWTPPPVGVHHSSYSRASPMEVGELSVGELKRQVVAGSEAWRWRLILCT
ncbi:unnamed protein product [Chrysoparadoxa australica]